MSRNSEQTETSEENFNIYFLSYLKRNRFVDTANNFIKEIKQSNDQEDIIKSNKSFLFEWWNIFCYCYSKEFIKMFRLKNNEKYPTNLLNKISFEMLFKDYSFQNSNDIINESSALSYSLSEPSIQISEPQPIAKQAINQISILSLNGKQTDRDSNHNLSQVNEVNDDDVVNTNKKTLPLKNPHDFLNKKTKRSLKNNKYVYLRQFNNDKKKVDQTSANTDPNNDDWEGKEDPDDDSEEKKVSAFKHKPRGSTYRGVSRNGNQWQVLIMVDKKKRYVKSYMEEIDAAKAYDRVAIQNHGNKAKTNFDYNYEQIQDILNSSPLLRTLK